MSRTRTSTRGMELYERLLKDMTRLHDLLDRAAKAHSTLEPKVAAHRTKQAVFDLRTQLRKLHYDPQDALSSLPEKEPARE